MDILLDFIKVTQVKTLNSLLSGSMLAVTFPVSDHRCSYDCTYTIFFFTWPLFMTCQNLDTFRKYILSGNHLQVPGELHMPVCSYNSLGLQRELRTMSV